MCWTKQSSPSRALSEDCSDVGHATLCSRTDRRKENASERQCTETRMSTARINQIDEREREIRHTLIPMQRLRIRILSPCQVAHLKDLIVIDFALWSTFTVNSTNWQKSAHHMHRTGSTDRRI